MLAINNEAPNFKLSDANGNSLELRQFTDQKNVVLMFYPFDWGPDGNDQFLLYNEMRPIYDERDAVLIGISTDSIYCHSAYSENLRLHFPLLADFEPKGNVARAYGAYNEQKGYCRRALFVIDKNQMIVWNEVIADNKTHSAEGLLGALDMIISQSLS